MIPDTEEAFEEAGMEDVPEVKVEPEPRPPEETLQELSEEWIKAMKGEPGGYYVEVTKWGTPGRGRIKISKHVKIDRAVLRELIIIHGILKEFEEDQEMRK